MMGNKAQGDVCACIVCPAHVNDFSVGLQLFLSASSREHRRPRQAPPGDQ